MAEKDTMEVDMDKGLPAAMCGPNADADPARLVVTWENRRRMAWYSFWAFLLFTIGLLAIIFFTVDNTKFEHYTNVYFYFASVVGAVILGYFGTTTIPFLGRRNG